MENLFIFLSSIRWQDMIDISLNSYILFRFYVLFRGTNVFRVLIGMTVLWFLQRIAISLGLIVTSWVVQGIVAVAGRAAANIRLVDEIADGIVLESGDKAEWIGCGNQPIHIIVG